MSSVSIANIRAPNAPNSPVGEATGVFVKMFNMAGTLSAEFENRSITDSSVSIDVVGSDVAAVGEVWGYATWKEGSDDWWIVFQADIGGDTVVPLRAGTDSHQEGGIRAASTLFSSWATASGGAKVKRMNIGMGL